MSLLRIYIRSFQLASDMVDVNQERLIIGDPPKVNPEIKISLQERLEAPSDDELAEVTLPRVCHDCLHATNGLQAHCNRAFAVSIRNCRLRLVNSVS